VPPEPTRATAANLRGRAGLAFVDAPVSGGPDLAERGEFAIFAGGAEAEVARARPVLDALGRVTRMGGAGQTAKMLNQSLVGVGYVEAAEVLALARRAGIDPTQLSSGAGRRHGRFPVPSESSPRWRRRTSTDPRPRAPAAKDLRALRAFVETHGGGRPLIAQAAELYEAHARDHPKEDSASISRR
jgi:3-hydroxyisobutyrate dehydrogenase